MSQELLGRALLTCAGLLGSAQPKGKGDTVKSRLVGYTLLNRVLKVMHVPEGEFDIVRLQPDGSELHVGKAASYNIALIDVEMLASKVPAKYDRITGQGCVLNLSPLNSSEVTRI